MLELEESFFAIGIDIIGNRRPAKRNGFAEHFLHRGVKPGELIARQSGGAAARPDFARNKDSSA